jgi:hypothetical protein
MKEVVNKVKCAICGISAILMSVIGLLVLAQVVFGASAGIDVIANLQAIVNGFVGPGASLAGVITLVLIVALLGKQGDEGCSVDKK